MILQLVGLMFLSFFAVLEISSGRLMRIARGFLILGLIILFGVLDIQDLFKNSETRIAVSIVYVLAVISITGWALKPKRSSSMRHRDADTSG